MRPVDAAEAWTLSPLAWVRASLASAVSLNSAPKCRRPREKSTASCCLPHQGDKGEGQAVAAVGFALMWSRPHMGCLSLRAVPIEGRRMSALVNVAISKWLQRASGRFGFLPHF